MALCFNLPVHYTLMVTSVQNDLLVTFCCCYIILQTAALDGETDLKTRVVASACMGIDSELLHKIKVNISSLHWSEITY